MPARWTKTFEGYCHEVIVDDDWGWTWRLVGLGIPFPIKPFDLEAWDFVPDCDCEDLM